MAKVMLLFMWCTNTHASWTKRPKQSHLISHHITSNRIASFGIVRSQCVNIYYVKAFTDFCGEMVCHCVVSYYTLRSMLLWSHFYLCNATWVRMVCVCVFILMWLLLFFFSCPLGCWLNSISRAFAVSFLLFLFLFLTLVRSFFYLFSISNARNNWQS